MAKRVLEWQRPLKGYSGGINRDVCTHTTETTDLPYLSRIGYRSSGNSLPGLYRRADAADAAHGGFRAPSGRLSNTRGRKPV